MNEIKIYNRKDDLAKESNILDLRALLSSRATKIIEQAKLNQLLDGKLNREPVGETN